MITKKHIDIFLQRRSGVLKEMRRNFEKKNKKKTFFLFLFTLIFFSSSYFHESNHFKVTKSYLPYFYPNCFTFGLIQNLLFSFLPLFFGLKIQFSKVLFLIFHLWIFMGKEIISWGKRNIDQLSRKKGKFKMSNL